MKKHKLKKRKNKLRIRRKLVVISTLVLFLVLGIGYSLLSVNLNILGNITVKEYIDPNSLYGVFANEFNNGNLVKNYTRVHQDSMNPNLSTKNIYYWDADYNAYSTDILNKWNVIFGGFCWQMFRTTDTGGVKLIYNGEAVDNKCLTNRSTHPGYGTSSGYTSSYNGNYYYSDQYSYDESTRKFALAGNITTGEVSIGSYTCRSTDPSTSCSSIEYIYSLSGTETYGYVSMTPYMSYYSIGNVRYNQNTNSLSDLSYMSNKRYSPSYFAPIKIDNGFYRMSLMNTSNNYLYSDSISYDSNTNTYSLVSSTTIPWSENEADNRNLIGKYTCLSSGNNNCRTVYYVLDTQTNSMLSEPLFNGNIIANENLVFSSSITTNNGISTLDPSGRITISRLDFYNNYSNYTNLYYCSDYKSSSCQEEDIRFIATFKNSAPHEYCTIYDSIKVSSSFTYQNGVFTLDDSNSYDAWNYFENQTYSRISDRHYTCLNREGVCDSLKYIYFTNNNSGTSKRLYYITLDGNENIESAKNKMLYNDDVNLNDSVVKATVDAWYKQNMLAYGSYLEDVVYCSDRTFSDKGGWVETGGITNYMRCTGHLSFSSPLSCTLETDRYSISNNKAKLTYPVGLPTLKEMNLIDGSDAIKVGGNFWTMTPMGYYNTDALVDYIPSDGVISNTYNVIVNANVRPVVSLKPGTVYSSGDGSVENPYIINTN